MVSFLVYLKENKVTGTQSTGNLPRKVVKAVAARFVNPPGLETKFSDAVFRFQNEGEVWPIYFVHVLAQAADLVSGGPSRRWRLTPIGEQFLTLPSVLQVWLLFTAWWVRVNWLVACSWDIFDGALPEHFNKTVASLLLDLKVNETTAFEPFADQIIHKVGWIWPKQEHENTQMIVRAAIEQVVIDPLESFGILATQRVKDPNRLIDTQVLVSFTKTSFGHTLLETVREVG